MSSQLEVIAAPLSKGDALAIERDAKRHLEAFTNSGFALAVDLRRLHDGGAHLLRGFSNFGQYIDAKFEGRISAENAKKMSATGRVLLALAEHERIKLGDARKVLGTTGARALSAVQTRQGTAPMLAIFDAAAAIAAERRGVITDEIVAAVLKPQLPEPEPEPEPEPPAADEQLDEPQRDYELSQAEHELLDAVGMIEDDCLKLADLISQEGVSSPKVAAYVAAIVGEAAKLPEAHAAAASPYDRILMAKLADAHRAVEPAYERVLAGEIRPGDRVARSRGHEFQTVAAVRSGASAVRLMFDGRADTSRPKKSAQWWRQVSA